MDEFICREYMAKSTYSDDAVYTSIDFSIIFKIYKKSISILIIENILEDSDIGGGNYHTKQWINEQKQIINLTNFDFIYDYNNFIDTTTETSEYINRYQFKYQRCGPIIHIEKWDWANNSLKFKIPNEVHIFMNNFLDFFILFNINAILGNNNEKIPKCIILIVSSFLIEDDIIKLFEC